MDPVEKTLRELRDGAAWREAELDLNRVRDVVREGAGGASGFGTRWRWPRILTTAGTSAVLVGVVVLAVVGALAFAGGRVPVPQPAAQAPASHHGPAPQGLALLAPLCTAAQLKPSMLKSMRLVDDWNLVVPVSPGATPAPPRTAAIYPPLPKATVDSNIESVVLTNASNTPCALEGVPQFSYAMTSAIAKSAKSADVVAGPIATTAGRAVLLRAGDDAVTQFSTGPVRTSDFSGCLGTPVNAKLTVTLPQGGAVSVPWATGYCDVGGPITDADSFAPYVGGHDDPPVPVPECTPAQLSGSVLASDSTVSADGTSTAVLRITNQSANTCQIGGAAGVRFDVPRAGGVKVPAATSANAQRSSWFVLKPDASATAQLSLDLGHGPHLTCLQDARGLALTLPDSGKELAVPWPYSFCHALPVLALGPFVP